jgi:hypothetical protein
MSEVSPCLLVVEFRVVYCTWAVPLLVRGSRVGVVDEHRAELVLRRPLIYRTAKTARKPVPPLAAWLLQGFYLLCFSRLDRLVGVNYDWTLRW